MSDEDIARAIALSLQESATIAPGPAPIAPFPGPVHGEDDDEEAQFQEQLRLAMEASKAESSRPLPRAQPQPQPQRRASSSTDQPPARESETPSQTSGTSTPFLSERAQMEKERLARLKRLRGDSVDDGMGGGGGGKPELPKKRKTPETREGRGGAAQSNASSSRSRNESNGNMTNEGEVFWDGEVRQTRNKHVDHGKNGEDGKPVFGLTSIIGDKSQVAFAIISSYALQLSWIYEFFDPSTPVVMVAQPTEVEKGQKTIKEILPNWIRVTPFLRSGYGVMHMKFFLIFYKSGRLRVAISTANLVDFDWRDIENTVWIQDVPQRSKPIPHDPKADDFPTAFERVLKALNVEPALTSLVHNDHPTIPLSSLHPGSLRTAYDFSRVKAHLIPSLAGKHEHWPQVLRVGETALMKAVREIGCEVGSGSGKRGKLRVEYQGSSIGTYSTQWINEFYICASGTSPEKYLDRTKASKSKLPYPDSMTILFPTREWVRGSALGEAGGGTMFCRKNQWDAQKFPRELFGQSKSKRGKVLMHSKMALGTFEPLPRGSIHHSGAPSADEDSSSEDEDDEDESSVTESESEPEPPQDDDAEESDSDLEIVEVDAHGRTKPYASKGKGKGKANARAQGRGTTTTGAGGTSKTSKSKGGKTQKKNKNKKKAVGWAYVGSHNFTPSAWGTLSGSGFHPVLNITNYELGIVLPLYTEKEIEDVCCYERPVKKYAKGERPWIQEESEVLMGMSH